MYGHAQVVHEKAVSIRFNDHQVILIRLLFTDHLVGYMLLIRRSQCRPYSAYSSTKLQFVFHGKTMPVWFYSPARTGPWTPLGDKEK